MATSENFVRAEGHLAVRLPFDLRDSFRPGCRAAALEPEEEICAREDEVDARVMAPMCYSCSRRFRRRGDIVMDVYVCHCEDRPVSRRDESDNTAVHLAALHHVLAVGSLRSFADFAMKKKWH